MAGTSTDDSERVLQLRREARRLLVQARALLDLARKLLARDRVEEAVRTNREADSLIVEAQFFMEEATQSKQQRCRVKSHQEWSEDLYSWPEVIDVE